jgi:hypothetical protein
MPRQFGTGETVVVTDQTMLQTGYVFPPNCTRTGGAAPLDGATVLTIREDGTSPRL